MTDEWRLTDGFVAEEGNVLLTNLARTLGDKRQY